MNFDEAIALLDAGAFLRVHSDLQNFIGSEAKGYSPITSKVIKEIRDHYGPLLEVVSYSKYSTFYRVKS